MYMYICMQPYMHIFIILHFILASSVINIAVNVSSYDVSLELQYNITFHCAVHPDSSAEECEVRARDNSGLTRIGNII